MGTETEKLFFIWWMCDKAIQKNYANRENLPRYIQNGLEKRKTKKGTGGRIYAHIPVKLSDTETALRQEIEKKELDGVAVLKKDMELLEGYPGIFSTFDWKKISRK